MRTSSKRFEIPQRRGTKSARQIVTRILVSGGEPVAGWTKHKDNLWKAPMNWTLGLGRNQVFSGGEVMIEARFPNQPSPGCAVYRAS